MTTSIQNWQTENNTTSPFALTVLRDMRNLVLKDTAWVDNDQGDIEYWRRFRVNVKSCLDDGSSPWKDSPDETKTVLWRYKDLALHDLYSSIHKLYVKYSYDPYLTAIYKEKFDQAVDYVTDTNMGSAVDQSDYPLLQVDVELNGSDMMNVAQSVIDQTSQWMNKMTSIEKVRLQYKREILNCGSPNRISGIVEEMNSEIKRLDELWT